jgi:hypothetical protein
MQLGATWEVKSQPLARISITAPCMRGWSFRLSSADIAPRAGRRAQLDRDDSEEHFDADYQVALTPVDQIAPVESAGLDGAEPLLG